MEIFLLIVVLVFMLIFNSGLIKKLREIREELFYIKLQVKELKEKKDGSEAEPLKSSLKIIDEVKPFIAPAPQPKPQTEPEKPVEPEFVVPSFIKEEPIVVPVVESEIKEESVFAQSAYVPPVVEEQEYRPSFMERNPDLEKFIGENLINKIGIAILVLGIGFFVKYAIDQNWINEIARVGIGVLCGGILIGVAHKLRKTFSAFSSVLVGGGLSVLYFTIAIAFHDYHIFNQTVSFCLMVVVTAFSVVLSIAYDRKELAVLSIIGGFATPFMLSTGEGNYQVLFTYITVLNVGMLVLAYYKKWDIVNIICYVFTLILFGAWMGKAVIGVEKAPIAGAFVFATIFYVVFFLMNVINNVKLGTKFLWLEVSILLSNTIFYYSAGMNILEHTPFQGLFTALMAIFNMLFAYSLYRNNKVDKNIVYLLIGLVLTFVSLVAPVQLKGNYITLFWAAEAVLLYWFYKKSAIKLAQQISFLVAALMLVSLIMDWSAIYNVKGTLLTPFVNGGMATTLFALVSLSILAFFIRKDDNMRSNIEFGNSILDVYLVTKVVTVAVVYVGLLLELLYQFNHRIDSGAAVEVLIGIYNFVFLTGVVFYNKKVENKTLSEAIILLWIAFLMTNIIYYNQQVITVRNLAMGGEASLMKYFLLHYVIFGLSIYGLFAIRSLLPKTEVMAAVLSKIYYWFMAFIVIFILSMETNHIVVLSVSPAKAQLAHLTQQITKIAYPILWGVLSFAFMFVGMKRKIKDLRIISLSLFAITLLKLALFDLRGISEGGKIAAFISLGVILLVVSFMYQKLKTIILADDGSKTIPVNEEA